MIRYLAIRLIRGNVLTLSGPQQGDIRAHTTNPPNLNITADKPPYSGWFAVDITDTQLDWLKEEPRTGPLERTRGIDFTLVPDGIKERLLIPEIIDISFENLAHWMEERA